DSTFQVSFISSIIKEAPWQVRRWDFLAEVRIQEGEPLENALRRFKRKVQQEDIIKEVKRHSYYLKPGEKRRVKAALARKRNRKKARKEQDERSKEPLHPGAALLNLAPAEIELQQGFHTSKFFPASSL